MLEHLNEIDSQLFLMLNCSDSAYWDAVMWLVTKTVTWIPLLVIVVYVILKNTGWRQALLIIFSMAIAVLLADQISSSVIKPLVMRWRPTHDAVLAGSVDTVFSYTGGRYGFVSSHAANTFSLFALLSLIMRSRLLTFWLFFWAAVSSYSRIYLGVHYPGDILCGALLGLLIGWLTYLLYDFINSNLNNDRVYFSTAYTSSGFLHSDMQLITFMLMLTYATVIVLAIPLASW